MTIPYPFDLFAPGAVDQLLAFHHSITGDARMETDDQQQGDDGSDAARTDAPKPAPPPQQQTGGRDADQPADAEHLGEPGKRALHAIREERDTEKARAEAAEARVAELERAQLTDQERVAAERDDWRKKYEEQTAALAARDLDLLRRDVAAEKGLPAALARRLDGQTREDIEKDADALKALLPDPDAPRTPKPDPSAGSTGDKGKPTSVADAMAAYKARSQRAAAS